MKILFLDIDGVLNRTPHNRKFGSFDKEPVVNLEMMLNREKDLYVVISSAWRDKGLEKLQDVFQKAGIDPRRIIATTGTEVNDQEGKRELQILTWLARHPEVRIFVIFDDTREFVTLKDRLVRIRGSAGLTQRNVEKALEILNE
jgi:hypothetical protein